MGDVFPSCVDLPFHTLAQYVDWEREKKLENWSMQNAFFEMNLSFACFYIYSEYAKCTLVCVLFRSI